MWFQWKIFPYAFRNPVCRDQSFPHQNSRIKNTSGTCQLPPANMFLHKSKVPKAMPEFRVKKSCKIIQDLVTKKISGTYKVSRYLIDSYSTEFAATLSRLHHSSYILFLLFSSHTNLLCASEVIKWFLSSIQNLQTYKILNSGGETQVIALKILKAFDEVRYYMTHLLSVILNLSLNILMDPILMDHILMDDLYFVRQ